MRRRHSSPTLTCTRALSSVWACSCRVLPSITWERNGTTTLPRDARPPGAEYHRGKTLKGNVPSGRGSSSLSEQNRAPSSFSSIVVRLVLVVA